MKNKFLFFLLLHSFLIRLSIAQTFTGTGGAIPDNGTSVDFFLPVFGLPGAIDTINFGVETVCININHTYDADLDVYLVAPDGTSILLTSGNGGGGHNYTNTCFSSTAATNISLGNAPFTGTYKPQGQLGAVNNGQDPYGLWKLHIYDTYPFADAGTLLNWSITFGTNPATALLLSSSDLPVVIINTNGQSIVNDPKIIADMGIIYNGPGIRNYVTDSANNYNGKIGIELRGHSSQGFAQKQYGLSTVDSLGNNLDVSLLNFPQEHDWILYAPYNDKSLMRNSLTYFLGNAMGHYASRCRFVELVLDGDYKGIYILMEKIKRDSARVDIAKLTPADTTGNNLTGGYICSVDWADNPGWNSNYPPDPVNTINNVVYYQYIYPKDSDRQPMQEQYIQQYVDSFETALSGANFMDPLNGWRKYGDANSFIDFMIMNELSKNVDGYRLSTYFYKDKFSNGGKINMGPLWDFNLAWHNADYCNNEQMSGWAYRLTDYCSWDFPFWWKRLLQDTQFRNDLKCRWQQLRTNVLDTTYIFNYMDSISLVVNESQQRHFTIWPILGVYLWPNPSPLATSYPQEISNLKSWIRGRTVWMDSALPGICSPVAIDNPEENNEALVMYPNPARDKFSITNYTNYADLEIHLFDLLGNKIMNQKTSALKSTYDISQLSDGLYFVKVHANGKLLAVKKLIKQ